jgi:hypothetical protein
MPRRMRKSARKALQALWNIDPVDTDSGEDGENDQRDDEFLNGSVGDSVSEENCSDCEEHESSETDTSLSEEESPSEAVRVETLRSKDETEWIEVDHMSNNGRIIAQNVFISKPGVKPFAKRSIESPYNCMATFV